MGFKQVPRIPVGADLSAFASCSGIPLNLLKLIIQHVGEGGEAWLGKKDMGYLYKAFMVARLPKRWRSDLLARQDLRLGNYCELLHCLSKASVIKYAYVLLCKQMEHEKSTLHSLKSQRCLLK
jgi:hypothetical protein